MTETTAERLAREAADQRLKAYAAKHASARGGLLIGCQLHMPHLVHPSPLGSAEALEPLTLLAQNHLANQIACSADTVVERRHFSAWHGHSGLAAGG